MPTTTIDTIRAERLLLVERLRGLPAGDWDRPSLCEGWTVRHVVGHLVTPFTVSAPAMAVEVTRHRSIGKAMDSAARRIGGSREPAEMLATLEANATSSFRPPGMPLEAPLTDVVAHSADIRWALGDGTDDWGSPERLAPSLRFLTSVRAIAGLVPPGRLRGVSLEADDQDWRHGEGAVVRGPSLALVMAILGRRAASDVLEGEGVQVLVR